MTRLGASFAIALITALQAAHPALALPNQPKEMVEIFAICSGRMEAMATRERAHARPEAAEIERLRSTFETLLEATLPDAIADGVGAGQAALWRNGGWREIAGLLADVDYSLDQRRADMAQNMLRRHIANCRALLL